MPKANTKTNQPTADVAARPATKDVVKLSDKDVSKTALMLRAGARLPSEFAYSDWVKYGTFLGEVEDWVAFRIGDWLLAKITDKEIGEKHKYELACEILRKDYQTLANIASVAKRVPVSRRREIRPLTWSHHETVAGLPAEKQTEFLQSALDNRWPIVKLRMEVRKWRDLAEGATPTTGKVVEETPTQREVDDIRKEALFKTHDSEQAEQARVLDEAGLKTGRVEVAPDYIERADRRKRAALHGALKVALNIAKVFVEKAALEVKSPGKHGADVAKSIVELESVLARMIQLTREAGAFKPATALGGKEASAPSAPSQEPEAARKAS